MSSHAFARPGAISATGRASFALLLQLVLFLAAGACGRRSGDALGKSGPRSPAVSAIAFVQGNYATPQSPTVLVSVPFTAAQTAGNTNVVAVGWNDTTSSVVSVADTAGNAYRLAVGPTARSGALTQSIYYATGIVARAAGGNAVRVTFSAPAQWPDIRALEYSGIDPVTPVDVTAAATGATATSSTPAVTTLNANDLLFAANIVSTLTRAAGTGFTKRMITQPDGDLVEDRSVSATGAYASTAPLSGAGAWVQQMVAFRMAGADAQPPSAPANLAATAVSQSRIDLGWTASTDNVGVTGYLIESCAGAACTSFAQIGTTAATSFSNTGLTGSSTWTYRIRATDAAGNLSGYSNLASATTLAPDTQPPTAPANLSATASSTSRIDLAWTAAADDTAVTGYLIERCSGPGCTSFAQIATATSTAYSDTGLSAATAYSYRVRATDAAGNLGGYSNPASATTLLPDTQPPTSPTGLSATAVSSNRIDLSWTASTDDTGVAAYLVERCLGAGCTSFAQIGSVAAPAYSDTGAGAASTYAYRVRASDAAGNLSDYSNVASASTPSVPVTPTFVQSNFATPQTAKTSVALAFTGAQRAGDFNLVVVGWNDTNAKVTSVSDASGNAYSLAIGPTLLAGTLSQSIYYAANIAAASAGANTVTVAFSAGANFADVRILEYRGIAHANALDAAAGASGNGASGNSGPVTTTTGVDLLVGANMVTSVTTGPGAGFTLRILTQPDQDMVEDRVVTATGAYAATAPQSSGGWVMQVAAFRAAPPDSTPPDVAVTAPAAGTTLTGTVAVSATASDAESGLQSIQLLVDGGPVGTIATTSPGTFSLDTTKFTNGAHTLGASALNGVRNPGFAAPVSVTFSNAAPGDASVTGVWSGLVPLPIVSVHVSQLPGGSVVMNDGQSLGGDARVWDTMTNAFATVPVPANVFCSGHDQMADGRVLVVGGHNAGAHLGLTVANAFDPATQTWSVLADMAHPRWYPSTVTLPDGRHLVLSGESSCPGCYVTIPEIYDPGTGAWTQLTTAPFSFTYYPHAFVLPDGRVLVAATAETPIVSQVLDLKTLTWTAMGGTAVDGGSSAMYRPGKILKTGTAVNADDNARPSTPSAYVLDATQPSPSWRQVASMNFARAYHTLTLLPDGNVLATGGGPTTAPTDTAHAILPAEVWSPATETWTTLGAMSGPRLYHSEALLLPDARVVVLGGGRFDDVTVPTDQFNAEFFSPPYLFKGPRPVITAAPATLQLGGTFSVQTPDSARIASVSLIRLASVTHAINMAQRFVPLSFTAATGSLTVTAPPDGNVATPGNYMLFLVDTNGVPSVAAPVRL